MVKSWQLSNFVYYSRYIFVLFCLLFYSNTSGQQAELIKAPELFHMLNKCLDNKNIEVYNFWATWCAPCIREIPQFESIDRLYEQVNVTLISLDDADELNNQVKKFIINRHLNSRVVLLDETDFNEIIPGVSEEWSGAIPATLIVDCRNGTKVFYEGEFKAHELKETIDRIVQSPQ